MALHLISRSGQQKNKTSEYDSKCENSSYQKKYHHTTSHKILPALIGNRQVVDRLKSDRN